MASFELPFSCQRLKESKASRRGPTATPTAYPGIAASPAFFFRAR
jgi:hypothetical protein